MERKLETSSHSRSSVDVPLASERKLSWLSKFKIPEMEHLQGDEAVALRQITDRQVEGCMGDGLRHTDVKGR